ncbi:MAG: 2-phospho-L-lactate transferase, partial [Actinobacteria bacterium]|nr:2-phospho-L-lactate transferase [Actinomycetota bacterium]
MAVSPIVAGAAIKGPADHMMAELGHEPSVVGVARLYARLAATLLIDESDAALAGQVEAVKH